MDAETLNRRIEAARGDRPVDMSFRGGRLVNVFSGRVDQVDLAVYDGVVVGFGNYKADRIIDVQGKFLAPAFMDGHLHLESSMLAPPELAKAALPHGTAAVFCDPHEIANVLGRPGIEYMLEVSRGLPLDVFLMLSSCVPATPLETSGAILGVGELLGFRGRDRVLGLAEMMNFPGLVAGFPDALEKVAAFHDLVVDGHAPLLSGLGLNAYLSAGIGSDHECTRLDEAVEKLAKGMRIMIREGTQAKDLEALLPLVTAAVSRRCMFVCDDLHADEILESGHLDRILRRAVALGLDPITAIQMVTINTCEYFGLKRRGALVPGYRADLVVLDSLYKFQVEKVFIQGQPVAEDGRLLIDTASFPQTQAKGRFRVAPFSLDSFKIEAKSTQARVIGLIPGQIMTQHLNMPVKIENGAVCADFDQDVAKLAVVERHQATGNIGLGLVQGFGLKKGALASSVAHDSHNIVCVGVNDRDIHLAVSTVVEMNGGLCVVIDGQVRQQLRLPVAGLMSDLPVAEVAAGIKRLSVAVGETGCTQDQPFMILSFLALPVIPSLKLTDRGLVDVDKFDFVSLFV
ncbi:MAG: adenine deaminase [Deltaproteobacteria bacterium]|nr:adenine deaminase [Deltaproteobacteria bacterium]